MSKELSPPKGYASWLHYAVTTMETRSLHLENCNGEHWPRIVQRQEMRTAAKEEVADAISIIQRLIHERDEWMQQYELLIRTNQHAHTQLAETLTKLARERDEAREDVLNALHVLEMYRTDTPEYKSMDVSVAVLWLKKAVAKLEGKP